MCLLNTPGIVYCSYGLGIFYATKFSYIYGNNILIYIIQNIPERAHDFYRLTIQSSKATAADHQIKQMKPGEGMMLQILLVIQVLCCLMYKAYRYNIYMIWMLKAT